VALCLVEGVTVAQEAFPVILLQSVARGWDVPGHAGGTDS
jgi:hypothetical protein